MLRSLSRVTQTGYLYLAGLGDCISLRQPALAGPGYTFTSEWKDKENLTGCADTGLGSSLPSMEPCEATRTGKSETGEKRTISETKKPL